MVIRSVRGHPPGSLVFPAVEMETWNGIDVELQYLARLKHKRSMELCAVYCRLLTRSVDGDYLSARLWL